MKLTENMKIVKNKEIAKDIYEMVLSGNNVELMKEPGQFVNLKIDEMSSLILRRPISICEIDYNNNEFKMVYRIEGAGTKILANKKNGDVVNVFGPLGTGYPLFSIKENETALLIGGGIGVPPLYELSKRLHERNIKVKIVLGFANKEAVFYEEEFKKYGEVFVCTVDGSYGIKGNVLEVIKLKEIQFDCIYSCGPTPMLRAINNEYKNKKRGYLSLEERMACGIGACYACVCETNNGKQARICKEGPVFEIGEVNF